MSNVPIEWWQPNARPSYLLYTEENGIEEGPMLGADDVICDTCNADVLYTPVAVSSGYALCPECFEKEYGMTVQEAAKRDGVTLTWPEPEKEGNNE